jgi:hypothetical protein
MSSCSSWQWIAVPSGIRDRPEGWVRAPTAVEGQEHRESGKILEDVLILMGFRNVLSALHYGVTGTRQGFGRALHPACKGWGERLLAP